MEAIFPAEVTGNFRSVSHYSQPEPPGKQAEKSSNIPDGSHRNFPVRFPLYPAGTCREAGGQIQQHSRRKSPEFSGPSPTISSRNLLGRRRKNPAIFSAEVTGIFRSVSHYIQPEPAGKQAEKSTNFRLVKIFLETNGYARFQQGSWLSIRCNSRSKTFRGRRLDMADFPQNLKTGYKYQFRLRPKQSGDISTLIDMFK